MYQQQEQQQRTHATMILSSKLTFIALSTIIQAVYAVDLQISDKDSICSAASLVADGMMNYYSGSQYGGTVGMFQPPYYWWQAGHAFGGLLDHWYYCQNTTYEDVLYSSLIAQTGTNYDYIPKNQSTTEGNDDQGFWGLFVMAAAERNFTEPHGDDKKVPSWLTMSQAVYNTMWKRWDRENCGGGLRWQIFTWNSGYNHKNTVSTACLFHMAGRLARFTGNDSYVDVADEVYQWLIDAHFLEEADAARVYDGADIADNCSNVVKLEWTYNYGLLLGGAAYLYNATQEDIWMHRVQNLVEGSKVFFNNSIMYERACQGGGTCNTDQRSFRAVFSRALGLTSLLVPSLYDDIRPLLEKSASAAAKSCSGGTDGITCGQDWTVNGWDNKYGLGEQMAALEVMLSLLPGTMPAPLDHNDSGVNTTGDYNAGLDSNTNQLDHEPLNIQTKDKAGAAIITAVVLFIIILGAIWMII